MLSVAPRIVNDVSYVSTINHEVHFAWGGAVFGEVGVSLLWQAQHLVKSG